MPYAKLNKSGCEERKGNVKIRLDFFLEPSDPRYNDTYLPIIDPETGSPTDEYQIVPFHSHFVHFSPDVTIEDIKVEIDFHLSNFYKAFQDRWDEVNGGMRHGWATEKRKRPSDYSKDALRVAQCQTVVDTLTEFSYKPKSEQEGKEFPATAIDVGPGATDRGNRWASPGDTLIDKANPANDTGTIDTFEVWAYQDLSGTNKVGTFYGSGTDYTSRDCEVIGTVTAGAKRTFTGLLIDVTTGDFAGIYYSAGQIERDLSGGQDFYALAGDQCGTGQQTYTQLTADAISIYATGDTAAAITLELRSATDTDARLALETEITLVLRSATPTDARLTISVAISIAGRAYCQTRAALVLATGVSIALRSVTDTRAAITLTVTEVTELELRSATDTRADLICDTGIALAARSFSETRAAASLATPVALTLRSLTDTRAGLALTTEVSLALRSFTATRATITISVTAVTELSLRSSTETRADITLDTLIALGFKSLTDTRATLEIQVTEITYLECRSATDTKASLALASLIALELRSSTSTRAALALTVALITELELRSLTATRAALQFDTVIVLALLSRTNTRAALVLITAMRQQTLNMALHDRELTMAMRGDQQ